MPSKQQQEHSSRMELLQEAFEQGRCACETPGSFHDYSLNEYSSMSVVPIIPQVTALGCTYSHGRGSEGFKGLRGSL